MAKRKVVDYNTGEVIELSEGESFFMIRDTLDMSWLKSSLSVSDVIVLLKLASMMTRNGLVGVAKGTRVIIGKELNMTERSVGDTLRRLVAKNLIADLGGNQYLVNPEVAFKFPSHMMDSKIAFYYARKKELIDKTNGKEED